MAAFDFVRPAVIVNRIGDGLDVTKLALRGEKVRDVIRGERTSDALGLGCGALGFPRGQLNQPAAGLPLGLFSDSNFAAMGFKLEPNDTLLLYTDGVTEASARPTASSVAEFLELDGLVELCRLYGSLPSQDLVDQIYTSVHAMAGGQLRDDIIMLALKRAE